MMIVEEVEDTGETLVEVVVRLTFACTPLEGESAVALAVEAAHNILMEISTIQNFGNAQGDAFFEYGDVE